MGDRPTKESHRRLGEILIEEGLVRPEKVDEVLRKQKRLGQLLVEEGIISLEDLCLALKKQSAELDRAVKVFDSTSSYLQQSLIFNDRLDQAIGRMADLMFLLDGEAAVRSMNPEAFELLGYEEADVLGRPIANLVAGAEAAFLGPVSQFEPFANVETELKKKDGGYLPVLLSGSLLHDEKGQVLAIAFVAKDLTERKQAEEALKRTNEEIQRQIEHINRAQEQLIHAEKLASVGLLTADVSHEILNPLNVIMMRLQILMSDPAIPPGITRHLKVLEDQANRIAKLSQNLLSFSRRRPPERRRVEVNSVARRTTDLLEHKFRKENIEVELDLDRSLPQVWADEDQIQQVIFNFMTNARDAMPKGGWMKLSTRTIQERGRNWVEVRVEDSGEGIAQEHLDRLFDPFFTTKPEGEGTGLGLSICQSIVKSHDGVIWAEQSSSGGAAFIVRLEAKEASMERKVLVVDDEPLICELLQEFLVEKGFRTIIAQSGEEALETYKEYRPDVVLLDLLLPGKNGLEVLKELKALDPEVAIFILTGVKDMAMRRQATAEGALDYINKPIDTEYLELSLRTRVSVLNSMN